MKQVRNNLWQQSSNNNKNIFDRTKIECSAQKNEIPVRASVRRMHKEMLNIGKIKEHKTEKQVVEILGKATTRRWPPKTNVGRKRRVQQLARSTHAHTQTDKQLVIGWRMGQGQLAKRCNWEIVLAQRSMRHTKPPHASRSSTKNKRKTNPGFPFVCVCVMFFFRTF